MEIIKKPSNTEPKVSNDNRVDRLQAQVKQSQHREVGKDETKSPEIAQKENSSIKISRQPSTSFTSDAHINESISDQVNSYLPRLSHAHVPTFSPSTQPQVLTIPIAAHQQSSTWNSNMQNGTNPDKGQPLLSSNPSDREIVLMKQSHISQSGNLASHNVSQQNHTYGSYNFSHNPQLSSLIHTQNVLCRQLEQLTDHNINLANQNSNLRAELEQSKEENLRMIHIRQIQAEQAYKQAADFEILLSKFEKSGDAIRKLEGERNSNKEKNGSDNSRISTASLEAENNLLRIRIQDLQEKNNHLEARVDELSSVIEGAGNLLHSQKCSKNEKNAMVAPPPLKRNETNDLAYPLTRNRQVTNEVSLPTPITKHVVTINVEDDNAVVLPTNGTNRQVTNEISLPPSMNHNSKIDFPPDKDTMILKDAAKGRFNIQAHLTNRSITKSYNNIALRDIYFSRNLKDIATQHYQAQMDKTFSMSADHSRFINLTGENSEDMHVLKNNTTSKNGQFMLKSPNLETDGDLKDEDEVSSDDEDGKNEKNEAGYKFVANDKSIFGSSKSNSSKVKNNNSEEKEYPYFIGNNLYDARLAMSRKRSIPEKEVKESKPKEGNSELSSTNTTPISAKKDGDAKSCSLKSEVEESNSNENSTTKRKRGRPKRDKSEGWPKRPLSAYNLFFKEQRIKILEKLTRADEDGDEHEEGKEKANFSADVDDDKPKRGRPFGSGSKRRRPAPHGIITFEKLGKRISIDWKEAPNEVKEKYRLQASKNLKKYQQDLEIFLKNRGKKDEIAR